MNQLLERVRAYIADDLEASDLPDLLARAEAGEPSATAELASRFQGPLKFGTAGLRGLLGAGPHRMNRATVLRATDGLVRYLIEHVPDARTRGLVVGRDARTRSDVFQEDVAAVAVAHGMRVHWLPGATPTPLTAYGVLALGAAGGVVVTASHNPPAYNGYKVFWGNGAQIIPPHDKGIAQMIADAPPAKRVGRGEWSLGAAGVDDVAYLADAYINDLDRLHYAPDIDASGLRVAYTAMHGVGSVFFKAALTRRGITEVHSVREQAVPDAGFPTVAFPNPEEPGALDRVLAVAAENNCDLVLAHDPDADRLGAAVRSDGGYRVLTGNEIGVLLAYHVLGHTEGADRLVVNTLVSSRQLARMAADVGIAAAETLTGFKWIANEAMRLEAEQNRRFVFGYEEALGYCCGTVVRDKDGIGAGVVLAEMAADYKTRGQTLLDALAEIRQRHGVYVTRTESVTFAEHPERIAEAMARLRTTTSAAFGDSAIAAKEDLSQSEDVRRRGNVLLFDLEDGGRVAVRPSGTEPKIKFYLETTEPADDGDVATATQRGADRLDRLAAAIRAEADLD